MSAPFDIALSAAAASLREAHSNEIASLRAEISQLQCTIKHLEQRNRSSCDGHPFTFSRSSDAINFSKLLASSVITLRVKAMPQSDKQTAHSEPEGASPEVADTIVHLHQEALRQLDYFAAQNRFASTAGNELEFVAHGCDSTIEAELELPHGLESGDFARFCYWLYHRNLPSADLHQAASIWRLCDFFLGDGNLREAADKLVLQMAGGKADADYIEEFGSTISNLKLKDLGSRVRAEFAVTDQELAKVLDTGLQGGEAQRHFADSVLAVRIDATALKVIISALCRVDSYVSSYHGVKSGLPLGHALPPAGPDQEPSVTHRFSMPGVHDIHLGKVLPSFQWLWSVAITRIHSVADLEILEGFFRRLIEPLRTKVTRFDWAGQLRRLKEDAAQLPYCEYIHENKEPLQNALKEALVMCARMSANDENAFEVFMRLLDYGKPECLMYSHMNWWKYNCLALQDAELAAVLREVVPCYRAAVRKHLTTNHQWCGSSDKLLGFQALQQLQSWL